VDITRRIAVTRRSSSGWAPRCLKALAGLVVAGVLAAGPARAAEALFLTWGDCALNGVGSPTASFLCNDESGEETLYLAFTLGSSVDQILGMEAVVDLQTQTDPLPDWWHFESAGPLHPTPGCRLGSLNASRDFSGNATCVDPWVGTTGGALVQDYAPGDPRAGTNQARIRATASVLSGSALALDATHQYYAIRLTIDHARTLSCAGCPSPACLVLNSIWLLRPAVPNGDVLLAAPAANNGNWARWQGETTQDCVAVPARHPTWGRIKTLYRR
jgi:hypothetical protein